MRKSMDKVLGSVGKVSGSGCPCGTIVCYLCLRNVEHPEGPSRQQQTTTSTECKNGGSWDNN